MFDIKWIRDNAAAFDEGLRRRGLQPGDVKFAQDLLALDNRRRECVTALQSALALRNARSRVYGQFKAKNDQASIDTLTRELAESKAEIARLEEEERQIDVEIRDALSVIPNLPRDDVPLGTDEKDNVEVRKVGTPGKFDFAPRQHFEIGEALGLMDFEAAQKISGARFVVLKGALARLERAIGSFMLDLHTASANANLGGYTEVNPPLLVKDQAAYGTGNLPKFRNDLFRATMLVAQYPDSKLEMTPSGLNKKGDWSEQELKDYKSTVERLARDDPEEYFDTRHIRDEDGKWTRTRVDFKEYRWLIPTAEVSLTNLVRESIIEESQLPMRMTAWTPCFRSEAGAAGRDTRGMIRQHQFSKVELVSITTPEKSLEEHERMTSCAEEVLKRLGLPFRTMLLCTGDMGFASQKTYDIEVWLPGQDTYREISSCSVCGDFQARRMDARYRPKDGGKPVYVHTLNGSGLAVGRTLIAVLENYQQADGSVIIPDALRPYMGGLTKIEKA